VYSDKCQALLHSKPSRPILTVSGNAYSISLSSEHLIVGSSSLRHFYWKLVRLRNSEQSKDTSKEVVTGSTAVGRNVTLVIRDSGEDAELGVHVLVDGHNGCDVAATVAVVGSRPNSDDRILREVVLVALVDELMSSGNQFETIHVVELSRNLVAKEPAGTTRANSPRLDVFGVRPDKIAESTLVRNLLSTGNDANLVDGTDLGTQATVDTEELAVDDGSEDQKVENMAAGLPNGGVSILLLALLVESIDLSDLTRLVITADKNNSVGVPGNNSQHHNATCFTHTYLAFRHIRRVNVSRLK